MMQNSTAAAAEQHLSQVIRIDEGQIRTNNPLERIMREIRRRSRVVGCFPDGQSALMLAAARLRYIAGTKWGMRRYLNMDRLKELKQEQQGTAEAAA